MSKAKKIFSTFRRFLAIAKKSLRNYTGKNIKTLRLWKFVKPVRIYV